MLNVSIRQLRYFVALAETASFSRAARRAGVTQSTLSGAIREMELALGVRLAERADRTFELTAAGVLLAERAPEIIAAIDDLPGLLANVARPLSTRLRLGVIPSVAPFLLPRALPSMRAAFPELRIRVREALSRSLIADLKAGELDAAIVALPFGVTGVEVEPFWTDRFFLGVSCRHALADRPSIGPADVEGERLLLLETGHCLREQVLSLTGFTPAEDSGDLKAMSLATLVQMADNDLGVTFLPEIAVAAGVAQGTSLRLIPYDGDRSSRRLALVWRERASRRPEYLILARHLETLCERHFGRDAAADFPAAS
jgi:LysR family hydrogen peroxide-inducible transcriptional activator